jgi:hypothetical protein
MSLVTASSVLASRAVNAPLTAPSRPRFAPPVTDAPPSPPPGRACPNLTSQLNARQREQWAHIPAPSRALLENSPAVKRHEGPFSDAEFTSLLSCAGTLARFRGRTSLQGQERIAAAALRVEMSPTDLALIEKSLSLLRDGPEVATLRQALADWRADATPDRMGAAYLAMLALVDAMPAGGRRDAMVGLALQIRSAGASALKEQFKQQLSAQLSAVHASGNGRQISLAVEVGPAAGLFGLELASATLKLSYEFSVAVSDTERLLVAHKVGASLKAGARAGTTGLAALSGSVTGTVGSKTTKVFPSVENCASYYADSMLAALAGEPGSVLSTLRGAWHSSKASVLEQHARTQGHRLQHELQQFGVLQAGETLNLATQTAPPPQSVHGRELSASLAGSGLKACKQAVLAGSLTLTRNRTVTTRYVPLLDSLGQEPALLRERRRTGFSIGLHDPSDRQGRWQRFPGERGLAWAEGIREALARAAVEPTPGTMRRGEQTATLRLQLQEAMFSLFCEYQNYAAVLNRYDGLEPEPGAAAAGRSSPLRQELRQVKRGFEEDRAARGRGDYLQAVISTHALLRDIYASSFTSGEPAHCADPAFDALLQQMEGEYRQPALSLSPQQMQRYLSLPTMSCGHDTRLSAKFELTVPGPLASKLEVEVRRSHVVNSANPDSDGDFLDIGLRGQATLSPLLIAALKTRLAPLLGAGAASGITGLEALAGTAQLEAGMALELNLGRGADGLFQLRYARAVESRGAGGSVALTTHGVKLGASAALREQIVRKEWLGSGTLSYVRLKYNATRAPEQGAQWQRFLAAHETAVSRMLADIGDRACPITAELEAMFERLDEGAALDADGLSPQAGRVAMKNELWQACQRLRARPQDDACRQQALAALETVLAAQHEQFKLDSAARFHS